MSSEADNVALIGMPAAGKTAVGQRLATRTQRGFVDTDSLIRQSESATLEEVIAAHGVDGFRRIETRCITELDCRHCVISTGGSVVYSEPAMTHLGRIAVRVYLEVPLDELQHRIGDLDARGVLHAPGQDLAGLLEERRPLYERWADIRVHCGGLDHDAAVDAIIDALDAR